MNSLLDASAFAAVAAACPGRPLDPGAHVALEPLGPKISAASSRIAVDVRRGEGHGASQFWRTSTATVAITPADDIGALRWRVLEVPGDSVGVLLASLLDLGPVAAAEPSPPAILRRDVLERAVGHSGLAARDEALRMLELDSELYPGWLEALRSDDLRHWTAAATTAVDPAAAHSCEVLHLPGAMLWLIIDPDAHNGSVAIARVTPREVWQALSQILAIAASQRGA